MKIHLLLLLALGMPLIAKAEIYKHVDAEGRVTYTNVPMKGAVKLDLEPPVKTPAPPPKSKAPAPANFPRVGKDEQKQRDSKRRQILEEELAGERKALEEAKRSLAEAEADPEVYKGKDGKTYRNVAKYQEKVGKLQEDVSTHQTNIEMLEKELRTIR